MLRVHIITKDNLNKEKVKNKWTNHTLATIKEIVNYWLDSKIAKSVLLFFKEGLGKYLHSYMPIVPEYDGDMPNVRNFIGEMGKTKILGVGPYTKLPKITKISSGLFQFNNDDDSFITGTMTENYWSENDVFILKDINTESFASELPEDKTDARKKPAAKKPVPKKTGAKKSTAKKPTAKKKTGAKMVGAKKPAKKRPYVKKLTAKKTGAKKTANKKPVAKKKQVAKCGRNCRRRGK